MLRLILTCEHGGNKIPDAYTEHFSKQQDLLATHRGFDPGALELFDTLKELADKAFYSETSRLLVELNRSLNNKDLFSDITKPIPESEKQDIIQQHYQPYREQVESLIHDFMMAGRRVLHVSVHTFTPELDGEMRDADIGLLYDPKRQPEREFCRSWKKELAKEDANLLVRFNYPYLGIADGFPTYLRKKFGENQYLGIELEVNQKYVLEMPEQWQAVIQSIKRSLSTLMDRHRKTRNGE